MACLRDLEEQAGDRADSASLNGASDAGVTQTRPRQRTVSEVALELSARLVPACGASAVRVYWLDGCDPTVRASVGDEERWSAATSAQIDAFVAALSEESDSTALQGRAT